MQTGEVWGGEGAGDNISWVPSENFRPSPAPVRCLTSWPLGRRNRGHFLAAGGASPQAEPLSLAEGRHPAEAWVLVPQPPPRVGGCGPCHLRRPPAAPRGVGVGAGGCRPPLGSRGLYFGEDWRGVERRGRGEGRRARMEARCPGSSSPALPRPQGLLANGRRCRLLPKVPDWHFHAFRTALKPVTVASPPPHRS